MLGGRRAAHRLPGTFMVFIAAPSSNIDSSASTVRRQKPVKQARQVAERSPAQEGERGVGTGLHGVCWVSSGRGPDGPAPGAGERAVGLGELGS